MLRYVCPNSSCLHTFLSTNLLKYKKCELCGCILSYFGRLNNDGLDGLPYYEYETLEELKQKYVRLTEKALRIGLLESERIIRGSAFRKLTFEMRKQLLVDAGLWQEGMIYKHVMIDGLLKMIPDKRKMYYERKKREKLKENEDGH